MYNLDRKNVESEVLLFVNNGMNNGDYSLGMLDSKLPLMVGDDGRCIFVL